MLVKCALDVEDGVMKIRSYVLLVASGVVMAGVTSFTQQPAADLVLTNGKIITVDDRFSIAQAVAVRGDRIVAVGSTQEINRLAGPSTRRIDLRGRAVTPGFIDNHAHFQEEGEYWMLENRLDGVESRKQAVEQIRARAKAAGPGAWIFTLGGWSPDQFADDSRPFSRAELDTVAPDNPVFLQFTREETYVNSKAIEATKMEAIQDPAIERDAMGRATGVIKGDQMTARIRTAAGFLKEQPKDIFEQSSFRMLRDLNSAGLTASGGSCDFEQEYREWQRQGRMSMRFFCLRSPSVTGGLTPQNVDAIVAAVPKMRFFDGDQWMDSANWGERLINTPDTVNDTKPTAPPELWTAWGRVARAAAEHGIQIFIHTTMNWTIEEQLKQVEALAKEVPIRHLRWTFMHMEGVTANQLERMRALGMYVGVHPRGVIAGQAWVRRHGDQAYVMPNLKAIQDSGVMWGFGTDAFEVNQYRPFQTIGWAVTGKMVGGKVTMRHPISREDALIAHTRRNAYFFFRENDLGSIQPGRLADMVVLDRDYLTVPADEIKNIKPQLTIVGGKVVYDAAAPATATQ
jgi:predicted amidohydrolase YtcJ